MKGTIRYIAEDPASYDPEINSGSDDSSRDEQGNIQNRVRNNTVYCFAQFYVSALVILIISFLSANVAEAQQHNGTALLDSLLAAENYAAANSALQTQLNILKAENNIDSLAQYPYYVGRVVQLLQGAEQANQEAELFVSDIERDTRRPVVLREAHMGLAQFYAQVGKISEADKAYEKALAFTQQMEGRNPEHIGIIENNRGVLARRMGDVATAIQHHRKALENFEDYDSTDPENYYISYNNMGAMMWFSSKTDSALYFYNNALETLDVMKDTPKNRLYRPANVLNNKAALHYISGRTTSAIAAMDQALRNYKQFIDHSEVSDIDRNAARQSMFRSIENLAGIYKELGNFSKTRELLKNSYGQKKTHLDADSPEIFKAQILLGQIELDLRNYDQALRYLNAGIEHLERLPDDYLFWKGDAHNLKARLYDEQDKPEQAKPYFRQAEIYFEKSFEGSYDPFYLDFLAHSALFYAENGDDVKALTTAQNALDYVVNNDGEFTLQAFKHRLNIAEVYYKLGQYRQAAEHSSRSLTMLRDNRFQREHLLDSVQVEFQKPDALLLQARAEYQLNSKRDIPFMDGLLRRMDEALAIIDKRRLLLTSEEDVNIQIANNAALFDFAKKIALELYQKTGNKDYLNRTVGYHESGLYNRIRSRINAQKAVRFADIPDSVTTREEALMKDKQDRLSENDITGYLEANTRWDAFVDTLQTYYPRYFSLRYGSAGSQSDPVIPENSTVIRYFFNSDSLYALLLTAEDRKLIELEYTPVQKHIKRLHSSPYDATGTGQMLHELYLHLWQPLEQAVKTERVLIVPDGELFNLSFETFATAPIQSFNELAEKSLLARHAISYHYSLNLLDEKQSQNFTSNLVAFAPGFDEGLKQRYQAGVADSLFWDQTYLSLLPQPFTLDLVERLRSYFKGTVYTGEESTEQQFVSSAGGHRIIHIGTHAESNNITPEYSRLFFAKSADGDTAENDNALYAWEIYNQNLSSHLTLLTACATGKPQYQPGEGMISLAHAFNYAGSNSLITALWNIDEQASAKIIDQFYQNLADGHTKDIALQQAKLSYLSSAAGRTAAPEYWAGLVLLGDADIIPLEISAPLWPWLSGGFILLAFAAGYFWMRRKNILRIQ